MNRLPHCPPKPRQLWLRLTGARSRICPLTASDEWVLSHPFPMYQPVIQPIGDWRRGRAAERTRRQRHCVWLQLVVVNNLLLSVRVQSIANTIGETRVTLKTKHSQDPVQALPVRRKFHPVLRRIMEPDQVPHCIRLVTSCFIVTQFLFLPGTGAELSSSTEGRVQFLHLRGHIVPLRRKDTPAPLLRWHQYIHWDPGLASMNQIVWNVVGAGMNRCVVGKSHRFQVIIPFSTRGKQSLGQLTNKSPIKMFNQAI